MTDLAAVAKALCAPGKGILAADESNNTCGKRLASIGMDNTEENRRDWRETLFASAGFGDNIAGVILYDETFRQAAADGTLLRDMIAEAGAMPGIKVDEGLVDFDGGEAGEKVTQGLESLAGRLPEYAEMGAKFAKWRALINIDNATNKPSHAAIRENASRLAKYAKACQNAGIVPIVEPEIQMDAAGADFSLERCKDVTRQVLTEVYMALEEEDVNLSGTLLKPNMVVPGKECADRASVAEVARATFDVLSETVPQDVPGIVFLSGGQGDVEATEHLNCLNQIARDEGGAPWALSFSYGRALQAPALKLWNGNNANRPAAQAALMHRARCNGAATTGEYSAEVESQKEAA